MCPQCRDNRPRLVGFTSYEGYRQTEETPVYQCQACGHTYTPAREPIPMDSDPRPWENDR